MEDRRCKYKYIYRSIVEDRFVLCIAIIITGVSLIMALRTSQYVLYYYGTSKAINLLM